MYELIHIIAVVVLFLLLAAALASSGWWLAVTLLRQERSDLKADRARLDAEWRALNQTRRVREVFLSARRAMQHEAQRQYQRGEGL